MGMKIKMNMGANIDEYYTSVYEKASLPASLIKRKYAKVEDDKSLKSITRNGSNGDGCKYENNYKSS